MPEPYQSRHNPVFFARCPVHSVEGGGAEYAPAPPCLNGAASRRAASGGTDKIEGEHLMLTNPRAGSRFLRPGMLTAGALASAVLAMSAGASPAYAQAAGCNDVQTYLGQRKAIGDRITAATAGGKKQIDAKLACTNFGQLVNNGQTLLKWVNANKDWCQIPDAFVEGIKADHGRAVAIRGRACGAVAKQAQMEKQAKEGGSSGLLGGGGLSGQTRIPQGAL